MFLSIPIPETGILTLQFWHFIGSSAELAPVHEADGRPPPHCDCDRTERMRNGSHRPAFAAFRDKVAIADIRANIAHGENSVFGVNRAELPALFAFRALTDTASRFHHNSCLTGTM